ncbi:D-alanine--D-alanine ligase [Oecophyllibacter saccharovorans]|uniref:D-alanine--D-alanine ligase n=1 Tax=Oecophyllibacter saccharovorans TaxID=2558360 RepID=UPI00143DCB30|nr:D-alanine--D-alanine ligase [Oecophyllibacter saccharovorans]
MPSSSLSHSSPLRIAVLMGGTASERPVSLSSGQAVAQALRTKGHDVHEIDVGADLMTILTALQTLVPDVVFNALHGPGGEDGSIQGVLNWLGLPYTHSGLLASATAMDKAMTRTLLAQAGLPVAEGRVVSPQELAAAEPMARPYVIKPVAEGSSFGVYILPPGPTPQEEERERQEIARNWSHGQRILVEKFVPGRELTVGVLEDEALGVTEIQPQDSAAFYDYQAKYQAGGSRHVVPAPLPDDLTQRLLEIARQAHKLLGCTGASRTDYRYDDATGELIILEVNTQPGMTPTSLLPEQAAWRGLDYPSLCEWMVLNALGRPPHLALSNPPGPAGTA